MSTGCIAALGQCSTTLTVTLPANCTQVPQLGGSPTVLMFAGYQVPTRYYHSLAESLAANGYAVIIASAVTNHSKMLQAMTGAKLSCSSMDTSAAAATQLG